MKSSSLWAQGIQILPSKEAWMSQWLLTLSSEESILTPHLTIILILVVSMGTKCLPNLAVLRTEQNLVFHPHMPVLGSKAILRIFSRLHFFFIYWIAYPDRYGWCWPLHNWQLSSKWDSTTEPCSTPSKQWSELEMLRAGWRSKD